MDGRENWQETAFLYRVNLPSMASVLDPPRLQLDRIGLIGPPLRHIQRTGGVYVSVMGMVEGVIEDLQWLQLPVHVDGGFTAHHRNHMLRPIENQNHAVQACNRYVVFEAGASVSAERRDVAGLCARHRHNLLEFSREREPLQHFIPAVANQQRKLAGTSVNPNRMGRIKI